MVRNVFLFLCLLVFANSFSQYSLSGKVTDSDGIALVGTNIYVKEISKGVTTSATGHYSFTDIPAGTYTVLASYIGYANAEEIVSLEKNTTFNFKLSEAVIRGEEIIVRSTRAGNVTPTTFTEVSKEEIQAKNFGQDLPYLLGMEPSLVYTSDAGAGIGYTGMWIRGSNIQRINVTVNGIPMNDPESHGVFFVNMPDFASSVESAQIQRGVGTSTNGGGAFGATINMETNHFSKEAFGELNSSFGSFNTVKKNVSFGSGLIKNKWAFEGRLSNISSDGYIDRASSDLYSFFVQGGYYTDKTTVKAVMFSGKEKTYQAWYGADDWTIENLGRTYNWAGVINNEDGTTSYYDNQTDNYQQDHYQLHYIQKLSNDISFNISGHYTYGRGYYEEYNPQESLNQYPIGTQYFAIDSVLTDSGYTTFYHDSVEVSDIITRRWLDNNFYGATYSFNFKDEFIDVTLGGAFNIYSDAKHYGEIIWAQYTGDTEIRDKFYENSSNKSDFNTYLKTSIKPISDLNIFIDLQYRNVIYKGSGTDKGGDLIDIDEKYHFFNPKGGITYNMPVGMLYASAALAHREPIRTDFIDAVAEVKPKPEKLLNIELGFRKTISNYFYNANVYLMQYTDQLVLTGQINDVGSPIRANVGESKRYGLELDGGYTPYRWFSFRANAALASSVTDYKRQEDSVIVDYNNVQLSYSPQVIAGGELVFTPINNLNIGAVYKYVSKQYLDLTQSNQKVLDAYQIVNLQLTYSLHPKIMDEIRFSLQVNNVFNAMYASNAYLYEETPYYFPQAGTNYMAGVSLRF